MKRLIARTLTSLLLAVLWLGGAAYAQFTPKVIKVNIPFEFNVGNKTFPAGSYSLVQPLQHFLVLRDARGQTIASAFTEGIESATPTAAPKLKFDSVAGQYTLTEVGRRNLPANACSRPGTAQTSRSINRPKFAKLPKEANRKRLLYRGEHDEHYCNHHYQSGGAG
jgi:hypothetical protein